MLHNNLPWATNKSMKVTPRHSEVLWTTQTVSENLKIWRQILRILDKPLHLYVGCSKSIWHDYFSAETNEAQEVCCGREVEGTFMCIRGFFPASRQCQSRGASVWVRVYMQRASNCYFLRKCRLVTQIESLSATFSGRRTDNNCKKPCQESRVPVEPQEYCVWPRKFESASARISRTPSARPNHRSKWNVPNHCLFSPRPQVLGWWHDGPAWPKSALG